MNFLIKAALFPLLFAFDVHVALPGEESAPKDDLVVFPVKNSRATPSPVTPSSSTPRVRSAYETAHLALRGVAAPSSELEIKGAQASRSSSPVEQSAQVQVTHKPQSEMQVLEDQLKTWRELHIKKKKSNPKTA